METEIYIQYRPALPVVHEPVLARHVCNDVAELLGIPASEVDCTPDGVVVVETRRQLPDLDVLERARLTGRSMHVSRVRTDEIHWGTEQ